LRADAVIYVDQDADSPLHNGSDWCHAYLSLQQALGSVDSLEDYTEIRVAAGTYTPTSGTDRTKAFVLLEDVAIYGGYAGCGEADPDRRDPVAYETILSGDLLGNDDPNPTSTCCAAHGPPGCDTGTCETAVCAKRASCCTGTWDRVCAALAVMHCCNTCGNTCDNSYHIVIGWSAGESGTAILDGFTIERGYADGTGTSFSERGPGIFNYAVASSPVISNCQIRRNVALGKGGGAYNQMTVATYTNCVFSNNVAPLGGAMSNWSAGTRLTLVNCTNCTLHSNTASEAHGGIWNNNSNPSDIITLDNCILWDNADPGGMGESAQMNPGEGQVVVDYSIVRGWTGLFGGVGNNGNDPLFVDADGVDDIPGTADDDLRLAAGSPCINTGDPATVPGLEEIDAAGEQRLQGCRVDRGAYETSTLQMAGDFDADDQVSLSDYASFYNCFEPTVVDPEWLDTCLCLFDDDGDADIDLADFAAFSRILDVP
ncbi:MAG: hypothetical protein KJ749_10645, partial [Planctomycetes bacterium]|nr:hypothetical protein [Planctomycetota bacterium]